MSRCAKARRARPLLGTVVEISLSAPNEAALTRALAAGFAAVAQVHQLMSRHDPASELSRLNAGGAIEPHPWTRAVLRAASLFSAGSGGVFDARVGARRDLDLGGIAKGFAVDRAVSALRRAGATSGIVNAGGDLRVFGEEPQLVQIRHPMHPGSVAGQLLLRNRAVATSASYFARDLFDGRNQRAVPADVSVTVGADDCMTADALTKVAAVLRHQSRSLLQRFRADALLLERDLPPCWLS